MRPSLPIQDIMAGAIRTFLQAAAARRVAWRRARNLRAGPAVRTQSAPTSLPAPRRMPMRLPRPGAALWIALAGALAALAGAVVIAEHARSLSLAVDIPASASAPLRRLPQFQALLPGAAITVPNGPAITVRQHDGAALLVIGAGTRAEPPLRIDLCQQLSGSDGRLVPLRAGYAFADVLRWAGNGAAPGLRAVALRGEQDTMPKLQISGNALTAGASLMLRWEGAPADTRWIGDSKQAAPGAGGQVDFSRDGWLVWREAGADAALHVQRQPGVSKCGAGQLSLQLLRAASAAERGAAVTSRLGQLSVFVPGARPVSVRLAPGDYQVPAGVAPGLEDQALFEQLRSRGMLRLGADGLAELAPRDLPLWRAAATPARAGLLAGWDKVVLDDGALKLLKRVYRMADGAYVREQLRIFNGERRLLAWRVPLEAKGSEQTWQASVAGARASASSAMPASATRLFAALAQGWQPWRRIDSWPADAGGDGPASARLSLTLPQPAFAGQTIKLMLIGRAGAVSGATIRQRQNICDGRACPEAGAAQLLVLDLLPGARAVSVDAAPLDMAVLAMPGDQQYRHLRAAGGRLEWLALPMTAATTMASAPAAPVAVTLEDRHGVPLWADGAPTPAAAAAGLAPLLGIRADHASSIAGMLARVPVTSSTGAGHRARLSLDLALQSASQRAVDCIGMRHGQWDGASCSGGQAPPPGRHSGMLIIDAENGDILAAAGAGNLPVTAANWLEVRNFDRSDPARSPLRLPALQHDGGAHASPGSTFKVISALGLEQAAQLDPRIDSLLGGQPLGEIDRTARRLGFAFQTDSPVYPVTDGVAHITNYKEQSLGRRAVDGRLGLAQALTYSLNTWFAWSAELSDRSLFGRADGGVPDVQALTPAALDSVRPIVGMARRLGFGQAMRLDGGLLPADFQWGAWDALQASAATIDPIHTRHELRQMAIGLRMQVTPLQMALASAAVGQNAIVAPRMLLSMDGRDAAVAPGLPVGVRLDRIRAGMKGVIDVGTAAGAFKDARLQALRRGLSGKTGTAPTGSGEQATVWFTGWLEPGSLPGQTHRLALAAFVSHSAGSGGEHAAPMVAAALADALGAPVRGEKSKQRGK
jgi:cell division protein FtsI/penicillin-binding protein 2